MITLNLTGIAEMTQHLQRLVTAPLPALHAQLGQEAKDILEVSTQLCPYESGDLVRSGEIEGPVSDGLMIEAAVRYGGHGEVPYAMVQEFDVTFNHPGGGQAHFLSQPLFAATNGFAQRIAAAVQPAVR